MRISLPVLAVRCVYTAFFTMCVAITRYTMPMT
jgi:hypothetical protein